MSQITWEKTKELQKKHGVIREAVIPDNRGVYFFLGRGIEILAEYDPHIVEIDGKDYTFQFSYYIVRGAV